ncbi:MAG TPA: ATP-binding protein [Candidatus Saccharibacteria bacterium]|nr:ATP-binding protein [Candidatus Saccharibacteria bacterium]
MFWYRWRGYIAGLFLTILITTIAVYIQYDQITPEVIYQYSGYITILAVTSLYIGNLMLKKPMAADAVFLHNSVSFERNRLVSLINSIGDAVIATDSKGVITLYNGAALELLNTNELIEEKSIDKVLVLLDESNKPVDLVKESDKANKLISRNDLHFVANEKSITYVSVSISPIRSAEGSLDEEGFIIVARDITKQKGLDDERKEFISVTSHELRTPIAVTEANISSALRSEDVKSLQPTTLNFLEQAHHNIIFLGDLVNDLTTLDKAERGDLDINIKLLDPAKLVKRLCEDNKDIVKKAGLALEYSVPERINSLLSSELYIREILQNFISNSLKYTKQGLLMIRVKEGSSGSVVFSVSDTGIGISNSDKKKVFDKFFRSEDYRTRQTRGTGLGLYITSKLAKRIRAKIWFDSQLNKGSTFYLEVPPIGALSSDQKQIAREEIKDFASSV